MTVNRKACYQEVEMAIHLVISENDQKRLKILIEILANPKTSESSKTFQKISRNSKNFRHILENSKQNTFLTLG